MRLRWEYLFNGEILEILRHRTWFDKLQIFTVTLLFLSSIHLLTTEVAGSVRHGTANWWILAGSLASAVLLLLLLQHFAKGLLRGMVFVNRNPRKDCQVLIVFLSPPDKLGEKKFTEGYAQLGMANIDEFRDYYETCSWRQPILAIHLHLTKYSPNRLQCILVIPSKDDPELENKKREALHKHGIPAGDPEALAKLVKADHTLAMQIAKLRGSVKVVHHFGRTVQTLASKLGKHVDVVSGSSLGARWEHGVHYEDAEGLAGILQAAFHHLVVEKKFKPADILIDITSGTALCSAIGAAVSLDENQRFQYVSTITGKVIPYDVEYVPYHRS